MIPRQLIDTAAIPGGGELRLFRRGEEWSIMLGSNELMNSRLSGSEEALATLACDRIRPDPHILIGGLGMGFTLRAALARAGPGVRIVVAELVPGLVEWARGEMASVFHGSLDDPRVSIAVGDVADRLRDSRYDAILLDVDNGPDGLTRAENDWLYGHAGLAAARQALHPGGVLAVWSSAPDARFTARLKKTGFRIEEVVARARGVRGARHHICLATPLQPAAKAGVSSPQ